MNITVYCGSSPGRACDREAARALGEWIGSHGHRLVYGGSRTGLMGIAANAALAAGGEVTGIMPRFLAEREIAHKGLTEFIQTETMAERKTRMIDLADAFIALPGGPGTLEELGEVMSLLRLGRKKAKLILFDVEGYWQPLAAQCRAMAENGYVDAAEMTDVFFPATLEALTSLIEA